MAHNKPDPKEKLCSKCRKPGEFRKGYNQCKECTKDYRAAIGKSVQLEKLAAEVSRYNLFDSWSDASAYALGLIFTDGNIIRHSSKCIITRFSSTDKDVIEWLHINWRSSHGISKQSRGNHKVIYTTGVNSTHMGERLIQLGVIPRKSRIPCRLPKVPTEFQIPFIRGLIDGDGCVYLAEDKGGVGGVRLLVSFTDAWEEVVQDLADILIGLELTPHVYKKDTSGAAHLRLNGKEAEKLCLLLYSDSSFCMKRKRSVWESYVSMRSDYGGLVMDKPAPRRKRAEHHWIGLLGTCSDYNLAKRVGVSQDLIWKVRKSLGIQAYHPHHSGLITTNVSIHFHQFMS